MPASQIYSVVNTIAKNLGYTGQTVVDATSFAAFASNTLSGSLEPVYSTLINVIGRTVVAIDEAEDEERGIIVDAFDYGSTRQKLSFITQDSQTNSDYDIASPENPYTVSGKGGVVQKFFEQTIPTFCWEDVLYDKQIREAFHSPETLAGFLDGLYTRMRNAYKRAKLGLSDAAIGAAIAYIYDDSTDANYSRRVRNLLTEFNTLYMGGSPLSADEALIYPAYLEYARKEIIKDQKNLNKLTSLYNTVGTVGNEVLIDRRTKLDECKLDLSLSFTSCFDKYYGDTFNEEYVKFPKHNEIVNWGEATDPDEINISLDGGNTTITVQNIIGFMYDKDAVIATMDRERFVSMFDQWNDRTPIKLAADRRFVVDPTENAILYLNT